MHGTFKTIETKADPLSLESLIAWLEKQPAAKRYDYNDCHGECLYGQYMAAHGVAWAESGGLGAQASSQERSDFCDFVYSRVATGGKWTFGAALNRARAVKP